MFPLIMAVITMLTLLDFHPPIQERRHWLKYIGIRISVANFDVNYGFSLSISRYIKNTNIVDF